MGANRVVKQASKVGYLILHRGSSAQLVPSDGIGVEKSRITGEENKINKSCPWKDLGAALTVVV